MIGQLGSAPPVGPQGLGGSQDIVDLRQRVGDQRMAAPPDPAFDAFFQALINRDEQWQNQVFKFVAAYTTADGERPYRTNGKQMEALQSVLQRLKEQGLENTPVYEETYKAFATVFGVKSFITQFSQEVFDPEAASKLDEEGW